MSTLSESLKAGMNSRFVRFLMTGGFSALVNIGVRKLLSSIMIFEIAVVIAYLIAMAVAYVLARLFVFGASGRGVWSETKRFATVNAVALCIVWIVSVGLARWLFPAIGFTWHADTVAHAIGVMTPAVTSYLGHLHFTFSRPSA